MDLARLTDPRRLLARPWLLAFVPINAATSGFGVLLPLIILIRFHGRLLDVAVAAALFNAAVILASMLWGYLSDRFPRRRLFLMANFGAFAVAYATLPLVPSLGLLFVVYTAIGLMAPAGASASNLLILERFEDGERPAAFASFQEMSILGSMGGLLVGYFWLLSGHAMGPLLYVFAGLAALSVVAVAVGVRGGRATATTGHVAHHPASLLSRLRTHPGLHIVIPFFPRRPQLSRRGLGRLGGWFRRELHHELPLILAATLLFNLSANLFNTSYTPYLYSLGLGTAAIFLVNFSNNLAQAFAYPLSGGVAQREGADRLVQQSSYLRALGYFAVAGFTFVPLAWHGGMSANVIAYAVLGGAIAFYSTASSLLLFRALKGRDAGTLLGVNSALGGVAAVLGSFLSGVFSYFGSFRLTFLISAVTLLASIPVWAAVREAYRHRGERPVPPASVPPASVPPVDRGPIVSAKSH
jgi:MFS family permease